MPLGAVMIMHNDKGGPNRDPNSVERRKDPALRETVDDLLDEVRALNGQLHAMDRDALEHSRQRFLKHAEMIWECLLEGKERV